MTTAYRDTPVQCPQCRTLMEARALAGATVDVCTSCKGLWVDWFDGELVKVARDAAPLSAAAQPTGGGSAWACPLCQRPLALEQHGGGAMVGRCGECAGSFVPRGSFDALVLAGDAAEASPPEGPFARLVAALKALLA